MATRHLIACFPVFCDGTWVSYTAVSLCEAMQAPDLQVALHVPAATGSGRRPFVRPVVPTWLIPIAYRIDPRERWIAPRLWRRVGAALRPGTPQHLYDHARARGATIVTERINSQLANVMRILDAEFGRLGLPPTHGLTAEMHAAEVRELESADYVFAPSPFVCDSLTAVGIPAAKVIPASYGWDPRRIQPETRRRGATAPTCVFVGTVCIRKGAHLLLQAWHGAQPKGALWLCGTVRDEVRQVAGAWLQAPGVECLGHVDDIDRRLAQADIMLFPTLEEGSPLVIYEAMARGLAIVTTAVGAGAVLRDQIEGIVLDPHDQDAWVAAIHRLCGDPDLRLQLGAAAQARAREFTWEQVGRRRREALLERLEAGRLPGAWN